MAEVGLLNIDLTLSRVLSTLTSKVGLRETVGRVCMDAYMYSIAAGC